MEPVLFFDHVSFSYHSVQGETATISDLTFSIQEGEFTVLVGPSGCGKSTLLSLACGLLKPEAGSIRLFGHSPDLRKKTDAKKNPSSAVPSTVIGYMFQKDHLFEWRTLYQNAMLGPELHKKNTPEIQEQVTDMIKAYGLTDFHNRHPSSLSGGMRQRAALIRTLAIKPDLLLLDEPFSALDYQTRIEVAEDITALIRQTGKTVLMVTHDLSEAISVADRILVLTRRPTRLKADLRISFPNGITSAAERRSHPCFSEYYNRLWKEMKNNADV